MIFSNIDISQSNCFENYSNETYWSFVLEKYFSLSNCDRKSDII
jgi:hypothetical protein